MRKTNYKEMLNRMNKQSGEVFFLETTPIQFMEDTILAEKVRNAVVPFLELKSYLNKKVHESKK